MSKICVGEEEEGEEDMRLYTGTAETWVGCMRMREDEREATVLADMPENLFVALNELNALRVLIRVAHIAAVADIVVRR